MYTQLQMYILVLEMANQWTLFLQWFAVLLLLPNIVSAQCTKNISLAQYSVLEELFVSTNGEDWRWFNGTPWTFPSPLSDPCSVPWSGITCVSDPILDECNLGTIDLVGHFLVGTIPESLFTLRSLDTLILEYNHISGTLSDAVGDLAKVGLLLLNFNNMTGTIPSNIGQLSSLEFIDLSDNSFSGTIPTEIGLLSSVAKIFFSNDLLWGGIPSEVGSLSGLERLDFSYNALSNTIPNQLYNITTLEYLFLCSTDLSGTISSLIGQLAQMIEFELCYTSVGGSLPTELGNLMLMQTATLHYNCLTGTLPAELANMSSLNVISLESNTLTGPIPLTLLNATSIQNLNIGYNRISGPLVSFAGLPNLAYLVLDNNLLTGSIPYLLSSADYIRQLALSSNLLTSSLPASLFTYLRVDLLYLSDNLFTGTVYGVTDLVLLLDLFLYSNYFEGNILNISELPMLDEFYAYNNMFTGTLPHNIGNLTKLNVYDVHANFLTGTIPDCFVNPDAELGVPGVTMDFSSNSLTGTLPLSIWYVGGGVKFNVSYNQLTGTLSDQISRWSYLNSLSLQNNLFTGFLPTELGGKSRFQSITANNNYFSGMIPSSLTTSNRLVSVVLSENIFTGTMPATLSKLTNLQFWNVSSNMLSGQLNDVFGNDTSAPEYVFSSPAASFTQLISLDISSNAFSGPIPYTIFDATHASLRDVVLFSNCFSGSISEAICASSSVSVLVMDSVTSASSCDINEAVRTSKLFKVVIAEQHLTGSVPQCLWSMSSLGTLHLAGNGLTGSLGDLPALSNLTDISLASNRLTGTIPLSWQQSESLVHIDLSSNKLAGTLAANFFVNPNATIDLTVNRLSGSIPSTMISSDGINILNENLFQCSSSDIPRSDPTGKLYVCGSDSFNNALIAQACGVVALLMCGAFFCTQLQEAASNWRGYGELIRSLKGPSLTRFIDYNNTLLLSTVFVNALCGCIFIVAMPAYSILKSIDGLSSLYSTHTFQYSWIVSIAYLHGDVPFILVVISGLFLIGAAAWFFGNTKQHPVTTPVDLVESWQIRAWRRISTAAVVCCHCAVVMTINVLYVFAVLVGLPTAKLFLVQFSLSAFKLAWNNVMVNKSLKMLKLSRPARMMVSIGMALFTFLVSPVLATFFTNDSCFRYVVTGLPEVNSSFLVQGYNCNIECHNLECVEYCSVSSTADSTAYSSVEPTWFYSYQCSSAVLVNYVPVLLFSVLISGMLIPAVKLFVVFNPKLWQLYVSITNLSNAFVGGKEEDNERISKESAQFNKQLVTSEQPGAGIAAFSGEHYLERLYLNLGMLLTFGLASPLLVVGIAVDCASNVVVLKIFVVKLIAVVENSEANPDNVSVLSSLLLNSVANLDDSSATAALWMVYIVFSCFWSIFCFDMMGDVYGRTAGLCAMIAPAVVVIMITVGRVVAGWMIKTRCCSSGIQRTTTTVEMNEVFQAQEI